MLALTVAVKHWCIHICRRVNHFDIFDEAGEQNEFVTHRVKHF